MELPFLWGWVPAGRGHEETPRALVMFYILIWVGRFIIDKAKHRFLYVRLKCGYQWITKAKFIVFMGFPGGPVVKNPPANAGDTGSTPGLGRSHIPRANKPVRHSYWACALEPVLCNKRSHCNEKPSHCNREQPPLTKSRGNKRTAEKTQHSQINTR